MDEEKISKEFEMPDYRFSGNEQPIVTIRTDLETILVETGAKYNGKKTINLLKKMEIFIGDRGWVPYPSVFWVSKGDQLQTTCFVKENSDSEEITVFNSPNGVPDGELMTNAKKAGIYTEMVD